MIEKSPAADPIRVLFVCTGNSARSIMAEALLRHHGGAEFEIHSAGTEPRGVNPLTVRVLAEAGLPTAALSSKPVTGFVGQHFDYVITVCDEARQSCPVFPGSHQPLHWSHEDPAEASGTEDERLRVFRSVFSQLGSRISHFAVSTRRQRTGQPVTLG